MSLYDEALECMERADNFLTNELTKAAEEGIAKWVKDLLSNSCDRLINDPTIISTYANPERVELVRQKKANLFELRAHILTRECALLQALDRISELPHRAVRMIRLCTKEARDLKIPIPEFQLHFWIFLTSLQTLDMFRRGTHCAPKPEDFINLRRKFLQTSNLLQQSDEVPSENSSSNNYNSGHMNTEEDSNFPSNNFESNASTLLSARFKALESLDLLEDISLQTEGTFNILARAVLASVVADDQAKCGRGAAQNQDLVGTSKWTVDLWRRACVALSRLGRLADLWPDPERRMTRGIRPDSYNGAMLISIMDMFNNSANRSADIPLSGRISFGGSFGAQISIAFVSSSSFEEFYRKFAGACIFFQSCSSAKRGAICMSLELADFFRLVTSCADGGNFLKAEALYHQATKIFLKESWMELATYSLLQQAFCQYVQWSTENVESIEASVFRRYVQTALILAIIPSSNLNPCYELLKRRGAYIDSFFDEDTMNFCGSSYDKNTKESGDSMRFFNVDLNSEGIRSGILATKNDFSHYPSTEFSDSADARQSIGHRNSTPSPTNVANSSLFSPKESVIQRFFRRSSTRGRSGNQFFKRLAVNSNDTKEENRPLRRPTSIDFQSFRGRLNTLEKVTPLPYHEKGMSTSGKSSVADESVFSNGTPVRRHKKGFSLTDFSSFTQSLKLSKNETSKKSNGQDNQNGEIKTTKAFTFDRKDTTSFYFRCLSTNLFHCKLPESADKPVDGEESVMTLQPGDNYLLMETPDCGFHLPTEIRITLYNDEKSAKLNKPCFIFSSAIIAEFFTSTWCSEPLLERLLPRVEQIEALRLSKVYKLPMNRHQGASAVVMCSLNQPVFLTVRVGDLAIGHSDNRVVDGNGLGSDYGGDFHIHLRKTPTDQNTHSDPVWNQRYTVDPLENEDKNEKIESWSDLGELILAPGEKPQKSSNQYLPGTRLCPPQSYLLRPKLDEQISVILPTGRPYPIHLQPVGVLIFNAKVSAFRKKSLLVQLRIGIRDITCPVLGSVNENDKYSHHNPFYYQERIAFRLSSPKLELKPFPDSQPSGSQSRNSSSSTLQSQISATSSSRGNANIRLPLPPSTQRSISVVEFAPPSPGMLAAAAPILSKSNVAENASQNHKEVGHSFFFSKDEDSVSTGSGDKESSVDSSPEDPIQFLESPDFEGVCIYFLPLLNSLIGFYGPMRSVELKRIVLMRNATIDLILLLEQYLCLLLNQIVILSRGICIIVVSYNRPLTVAWSVEQGYFNKSLRPTSKADSVGVMANFSFLVGSKYDSIKPRVHYTCNFTVSYGKSTQQNGFGGLFSRSGQKNKLTLVVDEDVWL
ncbi:unnamed protein product [Rodentolepis nana]|uniref:C2 domain-containing protein n=1 Tax=Rodentolepis nana TaxID=102285 RepID=A0A0R3TR18_RODNA|nr:unnamed protein product [Rodentolepis nana]